MTLAQTPDIPRVAVCSVARSGTSMLMQMLAAGGLTVDHGSEPDPAILAIMRNPNGFWENRENIRAGLFANSFKLLDPSKFAHVPTDYKVIYLSRTPAGVSASINAIQAAYQVAYEAVGAEFTSTAILPDLQNRIVRGIGDWASIVPHVPGVLSLDYDSICADAPGAMQQIANWLAPFVFDAAAASAVFDPALYIKRA